MKARSGRSSPGACHSVLAACIACALPATEGRAGEQPRHLGGNTIVVTSCDDSGPGSLRDAIASAVSGDEVDFSNLPCSTITLTSGELAVGVDDLMITGFGHTISAAGVSRVINHTGTGRLFLFGPTVADGVVVGNPAYGGCIRSDGDIYLRSVTVQNCSLTSSSGGTTTIARGGGVFSAGTTKVEMSSIVGNSLTTSTATPYAFGTGAGVAAYGGLFIEYSTISGNVIVGRSNYIRGGGFESGGSVIIRRSTISDNAAYLGGGGAIDGDGVSMIQSSTISGNSSQFRAGGIVSDAQLLEIWNSTIAFNTSANPLNLPAGAGVLTLSFTAYLGLRDSIIASNTGAGEEDDICVNFDGVIVGYNNLVQVSTLPLPPDTLRVDPMLAPLADNGGLTQTHALLPGSPAIDAGGVPVNIPYDQRGPGYPRISGPAADIGAFELAQSDILFKNGFDP